MLLLSPRNRCEANSFAKHYIIRPYENDDKHIVIAERNIDGPLLMRMYELLPFRADPLILSVAVKVFMQALPFFLKKKA